MKFALKAQTGQFFVSDGGSGDCVLCLWFPARGPRCGLLCLCRLCNYAYLLAFGPLVFDGRGNHLVCCPDLVGLCQHLAAGGLSEIKRKARTESGLFAAIHCNTSPATAKPRSVRMAMSKGNRPPSELGACLQLLVGRDSTMRVRRASSLSKCSAPPSSCLRTDRAGRCRTRDGMTFFDGRVLLALRCAFSQGLEAAPRTSRSMIQHHRFRASCYIQKASVEILDEQGSRSLPRLL